MSDDFMDTIEIGHGGGPPPGAYESEYRGVKRTEHPEYGGGLRHEFLVVGGAHDKAIAAVTTSDKPTPTNKAGRVIASITGASLVGGQKASLSACVGRRYLIVCEPTPNGKGSKVSSIVAK
jgi:hypothetical protein